MNGYFSMKYKTFNSIEFRAKYRNLLMNNYILMSLYDDRDERIFRDCQWNYTELYALVDKELYDDYVTAGNTRP